MKRVGSLIKQIADMDNLRLAFYKAQRGKKDKEEIILYREDLEQNLLRLREQIEKTEVKVGNYKSYKIHDPKERTVYAAAFSERVLHHALMNVCDPYFERQMIYTTCANRVGKGVYKALECAHKAMSRYQYVAKLDVRKYFDSINHEVLENLLSRIFKDRGLMTILESVINSYEVTSRCGLPIGNLTSQYFANYYLSGLDHFIKEHLHVPVYVRYMDDMLLFDNERGKLQNAVAAVEMYAVTRLHLALKTPVVQRTNERMTFLGYDLCGHRIGLSARSKRRFATKIRQAARQYADGEWTEQEYQARIIPLIAFVQHGYTKNYRINLFQQVSVVGL